MMFRTHQDFYKRSTDTLKLDISPDVSKNLDNNLNIEGLKDGEIREVHSQSFMSQELTAVYKKLPESPKF